MQDGAEVGDEGEGVVTLPDVGDPVWDTKRVSDVMQVLPPLSAWSALVTRGEGSLVVRRGDATKPVAVGERARVVAHVCNTVGRWGKGFVLALSKAFGPRLGKAFRGWHQVGTCVDQVSGREVVRFGLGRVQMLPARARSSGHHGDAAEDIWVANMVAQRGVRRASDRGKRAPIRYLALWHCLQNLAIAAVALGGASVHMPRIGCGLAGGVWTDVEPLVRSALVAKGLHVVVYDFP